jgi:hypothetical protein
MSRTFVFHDFYRVYQHVLGPVPVVLLSKELHESDEWRNDAAEMAKP